MLLLPLVAASPAAAFRQRTPPACRPDIRQTDRRRADKRNDVDNPDAADFSA
jgi:hypothetical protein